MCSSNRGVYMNLQRIRKLIESKEYTILIRITEIKFLQSANSFFKIFAFDLVSS